MAHGATNETANSGASQRSKLLEKAIDLALQGFAVFPLRPGSKAPLIKDWEAHASTDPRQIARWWTVYPHANIAIACGPSRLLVIDLDAAKQRGTPRHGDETLMTLAAGREIPRTFTVSSARDGRHLYFRQPDDSALRNTSGSESAGLGPLIDTRGHGGYVVAPGSRYAGGSYRIEQDLPVAPLPSWIADELTARRSPPQVTPTATHSRTPVTDRRRTAYGKAALRRSADTVATAHEGTRNHTLNREAFRLGRLVGSGVIDHDEAAATLRRAARIAGLSPGEIDKTITSGLTSGTSRPRSIPDRATSPHAQNRTMETIVTTTTASTSQATTGASPNPPKQTATVAQEETRTDPGADFDFEEIWVGVRASIERARQSLPDWSDLKTPDDLQPAIDEALAYLAQAPIDYHAPNPDQDASQAARATAAAPGRRITRDAADALEKQLAAVDAAYADARTSGIPTQPEWAGITAIHTAIHNVWDTIKAVAGTYWVELAADARVQGLLTTLATRAARAIATLANAAADHLDQRAAQQQLGASVEQPGLREAYINARNTIRAHAASHEWQRITSLWGTINTLSRQTEDFGIRAVVARSADAVSDYADTLARKTHEYGHADAAITLTTLAAAAERHASTLRTNDLSDNGPSRRVQTAAVADRPDNSLVDTSSSRQSSEAEALQARARQVAQHAQARLARTPRTDAPAPRRDQRANGTHSHAAATRHMSSITAKANPNTQSM